MLDKKGYTVVKVDGATPKRWLSKGPWWTNTWELRLLLSRCYKWMQHDAGNFWAICCWHRAFFGVAALKWLMKMMVALGAWVPDPEHLMNGGILFPKVSESMMGRINWAPLCNPPSNLWRCEPAFMMRVPFHSLSSFQSLFCCSGVIGLLRRWDDTGKKTYVPWKKNSRSLEKIFTAPGKEI